MLRPATPLSILLFASFVLLLISTISTPIVPGIPLARYEGVNFGVFGWCKDSGECSSVSIGWHTEDALPAGQDPQFNLPSSARHSLSSLLIFHPIAAFFTLVALGLSIAAHFHSPSHSSRYLLGLLILLLPTLLLTLLSFLIDVLLFVPHLMWASWIVLASIVMIACSAIVLCAMRRTLVSRKARKKRIAENAEMSGANFYARQAEESRNVAMMPQISSESKAPMVNGAPGADVLPGFAIYDNRRSEDRPDNGPSPSDPISATSPIDDNRFYAGQRSRSTSRPRGEDFGAPLGAGRSFEDRPPMPGPPLRGAYGPPRGRGGYPPRGAIGRGPSRGPAPSPYGPGRGGYPNRGRGMPPPAMMPLGNRRPPPGYRSQGVDEMNGAYGPPPPQAYNRPGEPGFEPPSPSNYGTEVNAAYGARAMSPAARQQSPYGARSQSPSGAMPPQQMPPVMPPMPDRSQYSPVHHQRSATGMDSDVLGMVEMQRVQPQRQSSGSRDQYVPPRAGWNDGAPSGPRSDGPRPRINSAGSDYMEDVDPKFAEQASAPPPQAFHDPHPDQQPSIPTLLMPGHNPNDPSPESSSSQVQMARAHSYEDLHPGARSPVESETSNFTSVSQRPMNPDWQPGHGGEFNHFGPAAPRMQQQQRKQDVLFNNNPDFELPGVGPPRSRPFAGGAPRGRGGYGGGGYRGGRPPGPIVREI